MKEMNKKYAVQGIANVMLMCLLVFMLPVLAKAEEKTEGNWKYKVNEDQMTVTVTKYLESEKSVNIPAILGGKKVVRIWYECFSHNDEIEEVVIPEGVSNIGSYAFSNCENLKKIIIPESVNNIESSAFEDCRSLESVTIPREVTVLENNVFKGCRSLESVTIPGKVTVLEESAFEKCTSLEDVIISEGVTTLESKAFLDCINLKKIEIPESVTTIESEVFENTPWLENQLSEKQYVIINNKILLKANANECIGKIVIPDGIISISGEAFLSCHDLSEIELPESVDSIGDAAFAYCGKLQKIKLPENLVDIGISVFRYCRELDNVKLSNGIKGISLSMFEGCSKLTSIIIPETAEFIGEEAFLDCSSLKTVEMSDNITEISWQAFKGCKELKEIEFSEKLTRIEEDAFYNTAWLEETLSKNTYVIVGGILVKANNSTCVGFIKIPDNVVSIGAGAFKECDNLTEVILPEGVQRIEENAFAYCSNLKTIELPKSLVYMDSDALGYYILSNATVKVYKDSYAYQLAKENFWKYTIIDEVDTTDTPSDSENNSKPDDNSKSDSNLEQNQPKTKPEKVGTVLKSDEVTYKVTNANVAAPTVSYVKPKNKNQKNIIIPGSIKNNGITYKVTSISAKAFFKCNRLTKVVIPKSVEKIGKQAFSECKKLKSITIKSQKLTAKNVGSKAFKGIHQKAVIKVPKAKLKDYKKLLKAKGVGKKVKIKK